MRFKIHESLTRAKLSAILPARLQIDVPAWLDEPITAVIFGDDKRVTGAQTRKALARVPLPTPGALLLVAERFTVEAEELARAAGGWFLGNRNGLAVLDETVAGVRASLGTHRPLDDRHARIPWRDPWGPIVGPAAEAAEAELRRELPAGHPLQGRVAHAVGRRIDGDDVLFHLGYDAPSYAVVHLTYQAETHPAWPYTDFFESLAQWVSKGLAADADDYAAG